MFVRAFFLWRHFPPRLSTRFAVVLLALLQFVAPSWHICDFGLADCGCDRSALASSGKAVDEASLPPCCRHKAHARGKTESCPHRPYTGFCLARFLESYFGSTSAHGPELIRRLRMVSVPDWSPVAPPSHVPPARSGRGPPLV